MKMRCSVQNCVNDTKQTTKSHGISFHKFPKKPSLRTKWMEALSIMDWEPKDRSTICSEHFRSEDFYETKHGLRKIKNGAIPVLVQDSSEDFNSSAVLKVCRICLAMDRKLYHITDYKLDLPYQQITGLMISEDDNLPQKLCWECAHRLVSCHRFRNKALTSQGLMAHVLENEKHLSIISLKNIDRNAYGLNTNLIQALKTGDSDVNGDVTDDAIDYDVQEEFQAVRLEVEKKREDKEIQVNECSFESEDEKTLSEMNKGKQKLKKKPAKVNKDVDNPMMTMDKYKISDVKRLKISDSLDESLFSIKSLTYEEQMEEVSKRQHTSAYLSAPYKCDVCYRGFLIKDRYDAHVVRHTEQCGAYQCLICKTRFKTARALKRHLTAHHSEQFSCKGCPFVTRNRCVARGHEKWHAGTKYQCPHCPCEFDKMTTYMSHIRIKHVSDSVCELCGYTFLSQKGIEVHKQKMHRLHDETQTLDGPYCEVCDVKFISEDAHSRHLKLSSKHRSDDDPNRIRNSNMGGDKAIASVERRKGRPPIAKDSNRPEPKLVDCEQCGAQLCGMLQYMYHFKREHPEKQRTKYPNLKNSVMCDQCGKIFHRKALLIDHMWVHTGEKRFKCSLCDKSFSMHINLVNHQMVHSEQRPVYDCEICGKGFLFQTNRKRHMFVHSGLKPFKCDVCEKTFKSSAEKRLHYEHVHLKKPWPRRVHRKHRNRAEHYRK